MKNNYDELDIENIGLQIDLYSYLLEKFNGDKFYITYKSSVVRSMDIDEIDNEEKSYIKIYLDDEFEVETVDELQIEINKEFNKKYTDIYYEIHYLDFIYPSMI